MNLANIQSFMPQQLMLPNTDNESLLPSTSSSDTFQQLLLQKIAEAKRLNGHISSPVTTAPLNFESRINSQHNVLPMSMTSPGHSIDQLVQEAARTYSIDEKLIHAIIQRESNYQVKARSHAGAEGLMQLMPGTARDLGVIDSFDPRQNINGGTKYLRQMLDRYHGNLELALAAYNAGPGNVDKYSGIPPFHETQNYVKNVLDRYLT